MQTYPVRTSHRANLRPEALEQAATLCFGAARREAEGIATQYGALELLKARASGKDLGVEVVMNPKVPEEVQRETITRYNRFLQEVTGYTAKERAKRARKTPPST